MEARPPQSMELKDGDSLTLTAGPVKKVLQGREVRMLGYNGSIPGPEIRVAQGAQVTIRLRNRTGFPTTLHPHGVRLDYRNDGSPDFSQAPIEDGGEFTYRFKFPDPGTYWYHSHVREDAGQQLGLYGTFVVVPKDSAYWNPVDREVSLVLSDVLVDSAGPVPFHDGKVDHVLMGRFGKIFLVNGDTAFHVDVKRNEYVRFYVTNAASARVFNFVLNRTYMKVVGSDNGKYERSYLSAGELIAPGERMVFEAMFKDTGVVELLQETPTRLFTIGTVHVLPDSAESGYRAAYTVEDTAREVMGDIDAFRPYFDKAPDKEILLTGIMEGMGMPGMGMPMAKAGAAAKVSASEDGGSPKGVEWVDTMGAMNSLSTIENTHWVIRDMHTMEENHNIFWHFNLGDKVLIRVHSDSKAIHSMPHPLHFHGQRFLVVNVDGVRNTDLAWKDIYLVGAGSTVDLLLDAGNPGGWMAHCHIAEHLEDMMMFYFHIGD